MPAEIVPGLLNGLRVAEYGDDVAVRYCGRMFAALGGQVWRAASRSDHHIGFCGEDGALYGQWLDQGKQVVSKEALPQRQADVIVGGLTPEALASAQAHAALQPHAQALVLLRWFGTSGPYATWQGSDEIIAAISGLSFSFGQPDGPPMLAQGHIPQVTAGLVAFIAALSSCMQARQATRHVEVNVLEATLCYSETGAVAAAVEDTVSTRLGVNRYHPTYPCGAYKASDGWVGVTCLTPAQWSAMCNAIGRPELASDPRYATALQRLENADEVDLILDGPLALRSVAEWVSIGMKDRIPIAPMPRPAALPHQPHWRERGAFAQVADQPHWGPTLPFRATASAVVATSDGVTASAAASVSANALSASSAAVPSAAGAAHTACLLQGLRVLDFSMGWSGPLCTRILADLGAVVTKVESEGHPDWWRGWETGPEAALLRERRSGFLNMNRGKIGISIDMTAPGSRARVEALARNADVVIDNFAAGVMEKLGLSHGVFHTWNPAAVVLSMPGFGNGGEWSPIRAYGSTAEQASGMPYINGRQDWRPALQHIALGDPVAGLYAAAAILAACYARGRLQNITLDIAQTSCLFQLGADSILAEQRRAEPLLRTGNQRARAAHCAVVRCAGDEQWLAVVVKDAAELERLVAFLGAEDGDGACSNNNSVDVRVSRWAAHRDVGEAASALQRIAIAAGPVNRATAVGRMAQLQVGGYWRIIDRAIIGKHLVSAGAWIVDGKRPANLSPAPLLAAIQDDGAR